MKIWDDNPDCDSRMCCDSCKYDLNVGIHLLAVPNYAHIMHQGSDQCLKSF